MPNPQVTFSLLTLTGYCARLVELSRQNELWGENMNISQCSHGKIMPKSFENLQKMKKTFSLLKMPVIPKTASNAFFEGYSFAIFSDILS